MNEQCVFCEIVAGRLPANIVYEDEHAIAFLDIHPVTKGHTLVIPKDHYDPIMKTPLKTLEKLMGAVRKIAIAQADGLKADGINVTQANGELAGQEIKHIHFHVLPRYINDSHSWNYPQKAYDSDVEMKAYADRIRKAIA